MIYEVHITVAEGQGAPYLFGTKTIRLELESGKNRVQTLVGAKEEFSNDTDAIAWTFDLERELVRRGYKLARRKLEAPLLDYQDKTPLYSEAHWKFEFKKISDVFKFEEFRRTEEKHDAGYLLSWSLDKKDKAWLTKRFYGDHKYARSFFSRSNAEIQHNFPIPPVHFEAVIVDTNLDLDEGWVAK